MPADFGEIADYHNQEAARHSALAQAARDCGNRAEAEYLTGLAARDAEAAQQQKIGMRQQPGRSPAKQAPRRWPPEPQPVPAPLVAVCLLAVLHGAEHLATAIRQSFSRLSDRDRVMALHLR